MPTTGPQVPFTSQPEKIPRGRVQAHSERQVKAWVCPAQWAQTGGTAWGQERQRHRQPLLLALVLKGGGESF